jgi:3-hydroxy-3-methylglutaryl CoA synthase
MLENYNIGRLKVGTETTLDESKSLKTQDWNCDIEGIDGKNAYYGCPFQRHQLGWIQFPGW